MRNPIVLISSTHLLTSARRTRMLPFPCPLWEILLTSTVRQKGPSAPFLMEWIVLLTDLLPSCLGRK